MKKLRVEEVIVVEGKYDAVKLADLVDGLIPVSYTHLTLPTKA